MSFNINVGLNNAKVRDEFIIKNLLAIPKGLILLDAGAGECPYKKYTTHLNYISQDFGKYTGGGNEGLQHSQWDNSNLDIVSDITAIPLEANSVDVILCTEVFEHIPDPLAALAEFKRLLKHNGLLILTAPFNSITHFAPYFFSTGFSRYFYEYHLNKLGFQDIKLEFNGNYFEYLAQEVRRIIYMSKKYSNKPLNIFEKILIHLCLLPLRKLSKNDKGSWETLCYGIHISAVLKR